MIPLLPVLVRDSRGRNGCLQKRRKMGQDWLTQDWQWDMEPFVHRLLNPAQGCSNQKIIPIKWNSSGLREINKMVSASYRLLQMRNSCCN